MQALSNPAASVSNVTIPAPYNAKLEAVALLGIFNRRGSGQIVRIREVEICPVAPAKTASLQAKLTLSRITAASGGSANGTATSLDSQSAALSDVTFVAGSTVTTSGAELLAFRQLPYSYYAWSAVGSSYSLYPYPSDYASLRGLNASQDRKLGLSQLYVWGGHADQQKIVMRTGEGIAVHTAATASINLEYDISVWIRNSSTGACYCLHMIAVSEAEALFSVMNGGATPFEILRIEITEQGPSLGPVYTIENIEDMIPGICGEQIVPTGMDSLNALNENVLCCGNCYVRMEGYAAGATMNSAIKVMVNGRGPTVGPGVAMGPLPLRNVIFTSKNEQDYVLREGSGMAVFNRGWANNADTDIIIKFTQEAGEPTDAEIAQAVWEYGNRTLTS
jgi:hypothetical protein